MDDDKCVCQESLKVAKNEGLSVRSSQTQQYAVNSQMESKQFLSFAQVDCSEGCQGLISMDGNAPPHVSLSLRFLSPLRLQLACPMSLELIHCQPS